MKNVIATSYTARVNAAHFRLWKRRNPILGKLDFELTERCNNDCIQCCINLPETDAAARQRELTTDEVKGILVEAASLGALSVRFTGGEPLLRDDFSDLYLFARRLGLRVLLFTNARLLTPELVKLFVHIPPLEKIEVTVYGMRRESYEAVSRVKGSFEQFQSGINLLIEAGISFVVKGAFLPPNRREVDDFETWASNIPAMDKPPIYSMFFDFRSRRDSPTKNRLIQSLRVPPEEGIALLRRPGQAYLKDMRQFCSKFMGPPGELLFTCGAGYAPCVDAYGALQPCLLLRHPDTRYNLRAGSLIEALTEFFPRLRQTRAKNPNYLARCTRCFLMGLCEQCPAKSWAEHGNLDTPVEYFCKVAHTEALNLGLLKEGEFGWEVKDWKERVERICQ